MAASRLRKPTRWWLVIAAALALIAAGAGSYVAVSAVGGGAGATPTESPSPTTPPPTPSETAETPSATTTVPSETATQPAPTATPDYGLPPDAPPVSCPGGEPTHVNIDKLSQHPHMADATISEIDANRVRIELEGHQFTIYNWGSNIGIGVQQEPPEDLLHRIVEAVNSVRYVC